MKILVTGSAGFIGFYDLNFSYFFFIFSQLIIILIFLKLIISRIF